MSIVLNEESGTYSHASGVTEDTALTISPTVSNIINGIWLDLTNLTQNCTIKVYFKIDGTNYREIQSISWTTSMSDGVLIEGDLPIDDDMKVTIQSAIAEGASRDIPYKYFYEGLGMGSVSWTYTLTRSDTGAPIDGANIKICTDSGGVNVVATGVTDSSGQITLYLDPGTYYLFREASGYTFSDPDVEVVS